MLSKLIILGIEKYVTEGCADIEQKNEGKTAVRALIRFIKTFKRSLTWSLISKYSETRRLRRIYIKAIKVLNVMLIDLQLAKYATENDQKSMYRAWARIRIYDLRNDLNI